LKGRDVLVVDAVLESGVTQEFLLRRLGESKRAQFAWRDAGQCRRSAGWLWSLITWLPDSI